MSTDDTAGEDADVADAKTLFFELLGQLVDDRIEQHAAAAPPPVPDVTTEPAPADDTTTGGDDTTAGNEPGGDANHRVVNGRVVPLNLLGFVANAKVDSTDKVLATIKRLEEGMYAPGHKAPVIGIFMGMDEERCVTPGFSVPKTFFTEMAKQDRVIDVAYPPVFKTHLGPDKFKRVIGGADDDKHRAFARWAEDSGARFILRIGWERGSDWMPFGASDKQGTHYSIDEMLAAHHHVIDVLESEAPDLFLYSDSHFRLAFLGNGRGKPPTLIDPATVALDPKRVHMVGPDIYPGGWNKAKQTIDQWFDYQEKVGGKLLPASLMSWGRWAKKRGLPLAVDEMGNKGMVEPQFVAGLCRRLTHDLQAEGIDVATGVWFHQADSRLVGVPAMAPVLKAYRDTLGSVRSRAA